MEEGWSIAKLLETLRLHPLRVAVVLNQEIVKRQHYGTTLLKEGDKVEIVTIMAGGGETQNPRLPTTNGRGGSEDGDQG